MSNITKAKGENDLETCDVAKAEINPSGHAQELGRSFNLLSACSTGITTGNAWAVLGGGIIASLYNGGPPGIIFELYLYSPSFQTSSHTHLYSATVPFFYCFVGASIAELASSIPASGGVYDWATITAGSRYGRVCGWFAGWLNGLAWTFAVASNCSMTSNMIIYAFSLYHPGFAPQQWHVFICYLIIDWICCFTVMFGQRVLPLISRIGGFLIITGLFITVIVCAVMPNQNGAGYASSAFVWGNWNNMTGYSSDGFTFLAEQKGISQEL
ncbi:choline transport protein [Aspergillus sclerotialis]|uniref:Choline transport protein n=1 Tax=Aspergillus sclerotialis TaxID=2070753 RepID=A0A3A2Z7P2_9EURO|nr:choline transport protein [Aspergillus sclerotialis]